MSGTQDLARRAVACKRWREVPGMAIGHFRVLDDGGFSAAQLGQGGIEFGQAAEVRPGYRLPDLTDPATIGCLLALVREAWGRPTIVTTTTTAKPTAWAVTGITRIWPDTYDTEAEALVAALEAAP